MPIPDGPHTDWRYCPKIPILGPILCFLTWPFSKIPRRWNAFESNIPPVLIWGNAQDDPTLDILEPHHWAIAGVGNLKLPVFFAIRWQQVYVRIAVLRFDYIGRFYTGPSIAFRRYKK